MVPEPPTGSDSGWPRTCREPWLRRWPGLQEESGGAQDDGWRPPGTGGWLDWAAGAPRSLAPGEQVRRSRPAGEGQHWALQGREVTRGPRMARSGSPHAGTVSHLPDGETGVTAVSESFLDSPGDVLGSEARGRGPVQVAPPWPRSRGEGGHLPPGVGAGGVLFCSSILTTSSAQLRVLGRPPCGHHLHLQRFLASPRCPSNPAPALRPGSTCYFLSPWS